MSQAITQARPYAKAIFDIAKASHTVASWLEVLHDLALLANQSTIESYINNPTIAPEKSVTLFLDILASELNSTQQNFVRLLGDARQLSLLAPIEKLFYTLYARDSQTVQVRVLTASEMSTEQKAALSAALEKRLQKNIAMEYEIDPDLIGGVIIRTDEWVMDGSVKSKLQQLKTNLVG